MRGEGDKPQIIKIYSAGTWNKQTQLKESSKNLCPFMIITDYADTRQNYINPFESFFIFCDRSPVALHHFRAELNQAITHLGLEVRLYGMHSFHAGRSVDLWKLKVPISTISKLGRWRSNCVYEYLKFF